MHTPSHGRPPSRGQAKAGIPETVHTYNALIAASHRAGFFDRAIQLFAEMEARDETIMPQDDPVRVKQQLTLYTVLAAQVQGKDL